METEDGKWILICGCSWFALPFHFSILGKSAGRWGPCFFRFLGLCCSFSKMAALGGITFRSRSCTERPLNAEEKIVVVHWLSCVQLFETSWTAAAKLSYPPLSPRVCPNSCPLCRWCHPTISSSVPRLLLLPSVFPSIRGFSNELALGIRWTKYWSFSFSISLSTESSKLICFKTDLFYLLAVQGTLKSVLQHHSLKASILRCSTLFMVQLSHPYMTTGKTMWFSC